jgi:fructose-1,6-bisphosphatase
MEQAMPHRRTTFSRFIIDTMRRHREQDPELAALLNDIMTGCKLIAAAVSRNPLEAPSATPVVVNVQGEEQKPLDRIANEIMLAACEYGGQLCGMLSEEVADPIPIPKGYPRGRYLLAFDPLDGSSNIDVNMTVGTIFSVLRAPEGVTEPTAADFLQVGTAQVAAGYALYGPVCMLVITLGDGVHGFTLDREIGAYTLTHPAMTIREGTREFSINASKARFWEPPVRRYVEECVEGRAGPRGADFNMRWIASMVAEVHRILVRGGMYLYPRDTRDPAGPGRLRLLYEANPMAMIVEQAGGAASTGRERIMQIRPTQLHQRVPVIISTRQEVERLESYHAAYDRGDEQLFAAPLFNVRSLFRTA